LLLPLWSVAAFLTKIVFFTVVGLLFFIVFIGYSAVVKHVHKGSELNVIIFVGVFISYSNTNSMIK
jgi:hypothetical protein